MELIKENSVYRGLEVGQNVPKRVQTKFLLSTVLEEKEECPVLQKFK